MSIPWTHTHIKCTNICLFLFERNWRVHFNELRTFIPLLRPTGNSINCHEHMLWPTTCKWKPTPFWRFGKKHCFVSTNFETNIQWSQSWSSQVWVANENIVLGTNWIMRTLDIKKENKCMLIKYICENPTLEVVGPLTRWWVPFNANHETNMVWALGPTLLKMVYLDACGTH